MKWVSAHKHPQHWEFEITYDAAVGYYLWIYKDEETMDYLQDTLESAQRQATRDFGVPQETWVEVQENK